MAGRRQRHYSVEVDVSKRDGETQTQQIFHKSRQGTEHQNLFAHSIRRRMTLNYRTHSTQLTNPWPCRLAVVNFPKPKIKQKLNDAICHSQQTQARRMSGPKGKSSSTNDEETVKYKYKLCGCWLVAHSVLSGCRRYKTHFGLKHKKRNQKKWETETACPSHCQRTHASGLMPNRERSRTRQNACRKKTTAKKWIRLLDCNVESVTAWDC